MSKQKNAQEETLEQFNELTLAELVKWQCPDLVVEEKKVDPKIKYTVNEYTINAVAPTTGRRKKFPF